MKKENFYAEQRGRDYSFESYTGRKNFIMPEERAIKNRYVYFAKFSSLYEEQQNNKNSIEVMKDKVYERLNKILETAKEIQLKREEKFISEMQNANSGEFKDFKFNEYKNALNLATNIELLNQYREYFSQAIMAQGVRENIYKSLGHEDFIKVMKITLDAMLDKYKGNIFSDNNNEVEGALTKEFRNNLWYNLRDSLLKNVEGVNNLRVNKSILEAFGGLGKIKKTSKSKITEYLKSGDKLRNIYDPKDLNIRGLFNNITGIKDEISSLLALRLKKALPNCKITYDSKYVGGELEKIDLIQTVKIPNGNDFISRKINISAKATNIVKDNFRTEAKLSEKASFKTRYDEIKRFTGIGEENFTELFYNLNNQIANGLIIKDKDILEILSLISINFMFGPIGGTKIKGLKDEEGEINLFLLGGELIPTSMIFSFMQIKMKDLIEGPHKIARASFGRTTPTIGKHYYTNTNYYLLASSYASDGTHHVSLPWQNMRNWLEERATMGFYLNTAKIFNMLKIEKNLIN